MAQNEDWEGYGVSTLWFHHSNSTFWPKYMKMLIQIDEQKSPSSDDNSQTASEQILKRPWFKYLTVT